MERLTEWHDDGMLKGVLVKEEYGEQELKTLFEETDEGYRGMCKLKCYEDTDLTPEQIMELKERDTEKEPEVFDGHWYKCPTCGMYAGGLKGNFCHRCGQRLKWEE